MKIKWHFIILAIYIILQIFRLDQRPPHWFDEAHYLNTALNIATHGKQYCDFYQYRYTLFFGAMPGLMWILAFFVKIFGLTLFKTRLFSVLCGAGILQLSFTIAKKIYGEKFAIWTLIIIATSSIFFISSRQVMPQPLATLFLLGALYYTLEHRVYLSGFLSTLSFLTHPIGLGGVLGCFIIHLMQKDNLKRFVLSAAITALPYTLFILCNWAEYSYQTTLFATRSYQICEFNRLSIIRNILSELPSRYFRLVPIGGTMWEDIMWYFTHSNRIYYLMNIPMILFLYSFIFCIFKKFNKSILAMTLSIMLVMAIHPNKFQPYLYMVIPFLSMMFAYFLQLKKSLTILLYIFLLINVVYLGRLLTTNKIGDYNKFIGEVESYIPKGSTVLGPRYFWVGLYKGRDFISTENLINYMERGGDMADFIKERHVDYVLSTCHSFIDISDGPRFKRSGEGPFREYLKNHTKVKDFLYENFYPTPPEHEEYHAPPGYGYNNVAEEYQKSLKIYKI